MFLIYIVAYEDLLECGQIVTGMNELVIVINFLTVPSLKFKLKDVTAPLVESLQMYLHNYTL